MSYKPQHCTERQAELKSEARFPAFELIEWKFRCGWSLRYSQQIGQNFCRSRNVEFQTGKSQVIGHPLPSQHLKIIRCPHRFPQEASPPENISTKYLKIHIQLLFSFTKYSINQHHTYRCMFMHLLAAVMTKVKLPNLSKLTVKPFLPLFNARAQYLQMSTM